MSLKLEFVGHACLRLWEDDRPSIVMDPFDHATCSLVDDGFRLSADTVIVSSLADSAHDNVDLVSSDKQVINALDVAEGKSDATINGEPIVAIAAAEIPDHPEGTDDNAIYAFKAGGLWFAHLGDLGFGLENHDLEPWKHKCDLLMPITGEELTLKLDELEPMIDFLEPTWIVPMHYGLPPLAGANAGGMTYIDAFLNSRPRDPVYVVRHHTVEFPLPRSSNGRPTIIILEPSGYQSTEGLPTFGHTS